MRFRDPELARLAARALDAGHQWHDPGLARLALLAHDLDARMAVGTDAHTLSTLPAEPYVIDTDTFNAGTKKEDTTPFTPAIPGPGNTVTQQLLQTGILGKAWVTFSGTLTVATAAVTSSDQWPYNFLKKFVLSANGQNDLWSCDGIDLAALRDTRFPAYAEKVDTFPGTVGGGDSIGTGSYAVNLTWEIPIAMDETSLVGSLYAQSAQTNLVMKLTQAALGDLFSANPANASFTGTFNVTERVFDVPYDAHGNLVIPDLTRLHGFQANETAITATGESRIALIRAAGQLCRLFCSVRGGANNRLSALPNAASTKLLSAIRMEYAGNKRPYVYNPASLLLAIDNDYYGTLPRYDRLVFDLVREAPKRDIILMQGVTELAVVPTVGSGVTVSGGSVRLVQETLF